MRGLGLALALPERRAGACRPNIQWSRRRADQTEEAENSCRLYDLAAGKVELPE
jgi:hypothetical protein